MSFVDAVRSCLTQYASFSGRARRSEYWWFAAFNILVSVVAAILDQAIGSQIVSAVVALALVLPGLAVFVRRMHDTGRSGWWFFLGLVPIVGGIVLLVFLVSDSRPEGDRYGPSPKYAPAMSA